MVKNLFKSGKVKYFLIMMISFVSLFFFIGSGFTSCGSKDEKVIVKIVYKPYASASVPGLLTFGTYADMIYDDLLDVSEDILTRLVARFGLGDLGIEDKDGETISPNITTDFNSLFSTSSLSSSEKESLAQEVSKLTHVYLSTTDKVLILANSAPKSTLLPSLLTITNSDGSITYTANSNLENLTNKSSFSSGEQLENNCAYRYKNGSTIAFAFVGGYVGSSSGTNSFSSTTNASNYVSKFFNSCYNNIQKSFESVSINDNADSDLKFNSWDYCLTESEFNSCNYNAEDFLDVYLEKYQLSFAVEIAKSILLRYENTQFPDELANLYSQAVSETQSVKTGSYSTSARENFIETCIEYIDHLGLLIEEKELLLNSVFNEVIGSDFISDEDIQDAGISAAIKENLETLDGTTNKFILASWVSVNESFNLFPAKAILEYETFDTTTIDDFEVKGFIQSIIIMCEDSFKLSSVLMQFEAKTENELSFDCALRTYCDGTLQEYPMVLDESELEVNSISFDFITYTESRVVIENCDDNLKGNSTINKDTYGLFIPTSRMYENATMDVQTGFGWCFSDAINDFAEIVFLSQNIFSLNEIDIKGFML